MNFKHFSASQVRIARPTDQLKAIISFYEEGLGLNRLTEFSEHSGYDGIIYGLPEAAYQLEFTTHSEGSPCPAPTKDNLLVFYIPDLQAIHKIVKDLAQLSYYPVKPENPYWIEKGITFEDPDGWRIVLMNTQGI